LKGATARLRNCGRIALIWTKYISQVLYFENSLFIIEQLTMLFAAQKALY